MHLTAAQSTTSTVEIGALELGFFIVLGICYAGWQLRSLNMTLDKTFASFSTLLRELADTHTRLADAYTRAVERQENLLKSTLAAVEPIAKTIVFARPEIYQAKPLSRERGAGVFSIRNVGSEAVFALGITRTEADGPPPEEDVQILSTFEPVELYLTLEPDLPPLDVAQVTLWYRDLSARVWVRRFADAHARRFVPPAEEGAQDSDADAEAPGAVQQ